jgi:AbrB family looped-hinge helix DNA binding protein
MATRRVGKHGTVVIPAALRQRFGITEGSLVITEALDEGVLIRPAAAEIIAEDRYRRLIEEANRGFASLKTAREAWREELEERAIWEEDGTLGSTPPAGGA